MRLTTAALFCLFVFAIAVSCNRKSAPVIAQRTELPPPPPGAEPTPPPALPVAVTATPSPSPMPMMGVSATDLEAGRIIYTTKCSKCHQAKPVENWTVDQWQPILKSMIRKSKLDSIESSQVRVWVNTHAKKV